MRTINPDSPEYMIASAGYSDEEAEVILRFAQDFALFKEASVASIILDVLALLAPSDIVTGNEEKFPQ